MRRKHMPGCYCCQPNEDCPACCTEEEAIPSALRPGNEELWSLLSRSYDAECCCLRESWAYIGEIPAVQCCELMSVNTWQTQDVRTDTLLKYPVNYIRSYCNTSPPPCDNSLCCVEELVDVCTWIMTINTEQRNYFAVWFYFTGVDISWTRETVRCPEANPEDPEPKCRYVMKIVGKGYYTWRVNSNYISTRTVDNTFLHPCYVLCENFFDCHVPIGTVVGDQCEHPELACSADINIFDPFCQLNCVNTQNRHNPLNCHEGAQFFCWERIKYFDEPPTGTITFTNDDVINEEPFDPNADCDEPQCIVDCGDGYYDQLEVNPPLFSQPHWCSSAPTIQTNSTNYTFDYSVCFGIAVSLLNFNCDPDLDVFSSVNCSDCCNDPLTTTVNCDQLVIPNWDNEENICRFSSESPSVFCNVPGGIFADPVGIRGCIPPPGKVDVPIGIFDCKVLALPCAGAFGVRRRTITAEDPCEPSECYDTFYCPEDCFKGCRDKFFGCHFTSSLETTLTISCETYSNISCIYPIPQTQITLEF